MKPSRRRVVAVIKNDWAQPNPKWLNLELIDPADDWDYYKFNRIRGLLA